MRKLLCRTFLFCSSLVAVGGSVAQESGKLSIEVVAPSDPTGNVYLPHGEFFEVRVLNVSDQPLNLWEDLCEPGYQALFFQATVPDGQNLSVRRRMVPTDVWTNYPPKTFAILPGKSHSWKVSMSDFFWGERAWQNVPEPNTGEKLEFRAVFESQESVASTRQEVWNGRIESKAQTLLIVNPKLQTPQDYLWNACPGQALKMMKDDPGLINKKSGDDECTPLHHAARFGHKDVVIWLIEHGAEVNAAAYNGFTPLHLAERKEIAEILIKAGAKLDQKDTWGKTPLQSAAEDRKQEVVEAILDSGYKLDLSTALLLNRRSEAVKMLISDANVIVGGDGGSDLARNATPLGFAAAQGDLPLIKLLLEAGAPINDPTECPPYGGLATPLCNAVWAGKEETVEFLLTHGASTNVVGGKFYISIGEFAEKNSNKKIVDLLTKYGTNARIERPYSQDASKVRNKLPARIASGEFKVPAEMKQDK